MHVALPLLRFSPFNNASALQKRTTRVTRAIDYWIYWQFVVVLVVLVVSVATQTYNQSPSLSPSMPSCGTFQCLHEGNTCRRCGPKPQVRHKCIGLPHLGGWNLESPMGIHPCWQAIHIWFICICAVSRICQVDPSCSSGRLGSHQHYLTQTGRRKSLKRWAFLISFNQSSSDFIPWTVPSHRYEHFSNNFVSPQVQITKDSHFLFINQGG